MKSKYDDVTLAGKIREFCDKLDVVSVGRSCDMMEATLQHPECGTPGCHSGWAAIALGDFEIGQGYTDSGYRLESYLGFPHSEDPVSHDGSLPTWAYENPELWGNSIGDSMFCSGGSFDQDSDIFPAEVLSTWWRKVADRLDPPRESTTVTDASDASTI